MDIGHSVETPVAPLLRVGAITALREVLLQRGVEAEGFMRSCHVDPREIDDVDSVMAHPVLTNLLTAAAKRTHCPHVGLLVGQVGSRALVAQLRRGVVHACTVHAALDVICERFRRYERGATIEFTTQGDAALHYVIADPRIPSGDHVCDIGVAVAFLLMRDLCGRDWSPDFIELPRRVPADMRPYSGFFKCRIEFNAPLGAVHFSKAWLKRTISAPPDEADPVDDAASSHAEEDMVGLVRGLVIRRLLSGSDVSAEDIAHTLGMSRRTLHRHLARAGATYRDLSEDARYATARRLLRDTDMPLTQLAMALGYSELSGLTRAFGNWSGMSPSAWRGSERPTQTPQ